MKKIAQLIERMETELSNMYHTHEVLMWLKEDPEYVQATLASVMSERAYFTSLGMVIGEAWQTDRVGAMQGH